METFRWRSSEHAEVKYDKIGPNFNITHTHTHTHTNTRWEAY